MAFLRLSLVFAALCLVLSQLELAQRSLHDQTVGLPSPLSPDEPLPPPSTTPFLGITLDTATLAAGDQAPILEELAAAGFGWARIRLDWNQIEPVEGQYEWESVDRALAALNAANLMPVLLLDGSPAWARPLKDQTSEQGHLAPPEDVTDFARFARAVAMRHGDQVQYYQIWDEPNIAPHWGESLIEPVLYARLLKVAATAIREADTGAYILLGALAPTADRGHLAQDEIYFLNRLYAAGAKDYFDAVAIQPFGFATRADDPHVGGAEINLRRTLLVRQTMLAAGDGTTPIWLMRFGWNRDPASPWTGVSAQNQADLAADAMEIAYQQWPWIVGMGWPAAAVAPGDLLAGFALTPALIDAFHTATTRLFAQPRPRATQRPSPQLLIPPLLWCLAVPILLWRGWAAVRGIPWRRWQARWLARPAWQQVGGWAILLLVYFASPWLPLTLLCWLVAIAGFFAQPRLGLVLALFLLPFHAYHKEFDWLGQHWTVPPAHAALICFLPASLTYRPLLLLRDRWLGVAASWAIVMLLGATGVWYWSAFWGGMVDLVIVPLLLFLLIRAWATTRQESYTLIVALAAGGLFQTALGLIDWVMGGGTVVDGLRRLTGPAFTSNHIALYLIRTLALTVGLALGTQGKARWRWGVGTLATGIALLLTGSRGALLLGVPAGVLVFISQRTLSLPTGRRLVGWLAAGGVGLAGLLWLGRERLANLGTMNARLEGWIVGYALWCHNLLFGVGPEGFWWTFPAFLSLTSQADPNLRHPHNLWLELATSGGLLALLWLLVVAWLLFRWVRARWGMLAWVQVGLLAGLVAGLAHAQMDAFQALPPLAGWNWAALALLLAYDRE